MKNFKASRIVLVLLALVVSVLSGGEVFALSAGHATCNYCHDLHGGPGNNLLNQPNQSDHVLLVEVVCSNCHDAVDPPIADAPQVLSHNALDRDSDDWRYISCRECHDPHDNQDNADGNANIMMVGYVRDPANITTSFASAKTRLIYDSNRSHSDPSTIKDVIFEDRDQPGTDFHRSDARGICASCHPDRNLSEHTQNFLNANRCTRCHAHSNGFKG
jgi:predicted CXXCH cytochrome family protein